MFTCEFCGKTAAAGTRCTLIPIKVQEFEHPYRGGAHKRKNDMGRTEYYPDEGGRGRQVVKEKKACIDCVPSATHSAALPST